MMTKKKEIVVFSIFTLSFAAAAAILDIFSQSSVWKKKIQQQEKPNRGGGGGGPDRISELPVEILLHILGFLEMDEFLIGTSLVSTKWRNLWKSVSTLNFPTCCTTSRRRTDDDDDDSDDSDDDSVVVVDDDSVVVDNGGGGGIRNNVEKYQNFVDNVLRLRDSEASKIQIFNYCCHDSNSREGGGGGYEDYLERFHNFIVSAVVNQGAQGIQIIGSHLDESSDNTNRIIHFNPSIFTSGLLRKFTFSVFNSHFKIQFPRSMCCATKLTHLTLYQIRLPEGDDDSNAQLHLVCPLLETLFMYNCISEHLKVLDISAPRLNTLTICNNGCRSFGGSDFLGGCKIEIRTPNLTTFIYFGRVYVDCFTENLPRIANASLVISKEPSGMMVEQTTSFAIKLLKGLTSAKTLFLAGFEFFSQDTLKDLLTPFTSLTTLKLATNCKISGIHGMVHFLNTCNSIEKLVWDVDRFVEVEGDEHLMLPQCRLSHLKHVHIKRMRGHENEIEFVKFLLKSSIVLEEITIQTTADSPKQSIIEENLKQFIEKELSFRSIKLCVLQEEF